MLIPVERDAASTSIRAESTIDPATVWGRTAPLIVEIGSGQGHAIVHAATARPEANFLAVEVFRAGLARTMLDALEHLLGQNAFVLCRRVLHPRGGDDKR